MAINKIIVTMGLLRGNSLMVHKSLHSCLMDSSKAGLTFLVDRMADVFMCSTT